MPFTLANSLGTLTVQSALKTYYEGRKDSNTASKLSIKE
jgi:hypothetical protein